ncbi:MAG TPA: hypothetical protein VN231_02880 [Allosphingosinicella sp.]|nr:hypothetical protein [Allosphingosinicella sp.]
MASKAARRGRFWNPWRIAGWGLAAFLLLLPAVAMRFTEEVVWTGSGFIVMGLLFGSVGLAVEFLVRQSDSLLYRAGAMLALLTVFLTIWVNLAVGMIGSEDEPYNLLFGAVLLVALAGSVAARFRPAGMALALAAAALVQAAVGAGGLSVDRLGAVLSIAFAGPWLVAAALFWSSASLARHSGAADG